MRRMQAYPSFAKSAKNMSLDAGNLTTLRMASRAYLENRSQPEPIEYRSDAVCEHRQKEEPRRDIPEHVQPIHIEMSCEPDDSNAGNEGRHSREAQGKHLQGTAPKEKLSRCLHSLTLEEREIDTQTQIDKYEQHKDDSVYKVLHACSLMPDKLERFSRITDAVLSSCVFVCAVFILLTWKHLFLCGLLNIHVFGSDLITALVDVKLNRPSVNCPATGTLFAT